MIDTRTRKQVTGGPIRRAARVLITGLCISAMVFSMAQSASAAEPKNKQRRGTPTKQSTPRQKVPLDVAKRTQAAPVKQRQAAPRQANQNRASTPKQSASQNRQRVNRSAPQSSPRNDDRISPSPSRGSSFDARSSASQRNDDRRESSRYTHDNRDRDRERYQHRDRDWDRHRDHDRSKLSIDVDLHFGGGWSHRYHPRPRYCPPPHRPFAYRTPVVYCPPPVVKHVIVEREIYCPPTYRSYVDCNGWDLLARGYAQKALYEFQRQAAAYPYAGLPRVGVAVAEAMLNDHAGAAYAMMRAFREDPEAMKYIPVSEGLDYQFRTLIEKYEYKLSYSPYIDDHHFMIAAISFFRHDYGRVRHELSYLLNNPECDPAVSNLDRLIHEAEYGG